MKIAIIDTLGLTYDGSTLSKRGLGGSESAVILISQELASLGFEVDVYNNCIDSEASPGVYNNVTYIDHSQTNLYKTNYDIVISSRSVFPYFANSTHPFAVTAKHRVLWMHDTFCKGDEHIEAMLVGNYIHEIFTLSDFHTNYISNNNHGGNRRMMEVFKHQIWQTRNGAVKWIDEVDLSKKDKNHFVYNASATKGLIPLLTNIWPEVKHRIPLARLTCIGGFYRFREGAEPDEQEKTVNQLMKDPELKKLGVTFTGVISQKEIASILANANFMLYPPDFPETFGISSLESLLYKTPIITSNFGALEETAIESACYKINYPAVPNSLYPNIDPKLQAQQFINTTIAAYNNTYLHQQKQNACEVVNDIAGWDTVALQWKQHFFNIFKYPLGVYEYRKVSEINDKVARIFNRRFNNAETRTRYTSYGKEQHIVVISPFWNAERYISDCIQSVAQQDYNNYTHILIDDNSTDSSYTVAKMTISTLPESIAQKFILIKNETNKGAIANQFFAFENHVSDNDIVMLLDGDDWLVNNNTIFHYYNNLYKQSIEFTYGSMWSVADNIPLIAQTYPLKIRKTKTYTQHEFNWGIPYTHLRTFLGSLTLSLDENDFKDESGNWFKAGADNPLFYKLIEQVDCDKIYCVKEIMCNYNDKNPLNDYKIRSDEQRKVVHRFKKQQQEQFSVIVPTMWKCKDLFLQALVEYSSNELVGEIIIINNDVANTPDWQVLSHQKVRMFNMDKNIYVNPAWNMGVELSTFEYLNIVNDDIIFDLHVYEKIQTIIKDPHVGALGIIAGEEHFNQPLSTDYTIDFIDWKPGDCIHNFGQCMFMRKDAWTPIIEDLNIYFGDDFIFHSNFLNERKVVLVYNINYQSPCAQTTSVLPEGPEFYKKEKLIYSEWYSNNPVNFDFLNGDRT